MRPFFAVLVVAAFCQGVHGEDENPLKGLVGVQFSSSVLTTADITVSKDRIARIAEDSLQKAGILQKGEKAGDYPLLILTIHGGSKSGVVFFVWELQVKEKAAIPANRTYRRAAFQGSVITWQTSGMMSTNPANMELDLMAQIKKTIAAFVENWRKTNPTDSSPGIPKDNSK
jgi:hypothetical protein